MAGYIPRWFTHSYTVTHPSTYRAWRRVTSLIETNALPLSNATNHVYLWQINIILFDGSHFCKQKLSADSFAAKTDTVNGWQNVIYWCLLFPRLSGTVALDFTIQVAERWCHVNSCSRLRLQSVVSSMSKATRATLANLGAGVAASAFHALVCARTPLTMTGTLSQSTRSQGQGSMSTFKADSAFMLRPRSPRPFSAISSGSVYTSAA